MKKNVALLLLLNLVLLSPSAFAAASPLPSTNKEIQVTLFGQPCLLGGPLAEIALQAVHSISPEKTPVSQTYQQAKDSLEKIKAATPVPTPLEHYRERLTRHFKSQLKFYEGMAAAKKAGKTDLLLSSVKEYLLPKQVKTFEEFLKKAQAKESVKSWSAGTQETVFATFQEASEPHPEEEFHRVIRHMSVKYTCTLEENDEHLDEEEIAE